MQSGLFVSDGKERSSLHFFDIVRREQTGAWTDLAEPPFFVHLNATGFDRYVFMKYVITFCTFVIISFSSKPNSSSSARRETTSRRACKHDERRCHLLF